MSFQSRTIFIVGCPRSGTTLLQQMLNAHSKITITPESHFMTKVWEQRKNFNDLSDDVTFNRLINYIIHLPEFNDFDISTNVYIGRTFTGERSYRHLFKVLLDVYGEKSGKLIIGEKTPDHLRYCEQLSEWYKDAKFINIIRDPRAVVNSWRSVPWSSGAVFQDAIRWRVYQRLALKFSYSLKDRFISVYYEDLVTKTDSTLHRIFDFIGVSFEPTMNTFEESSSMCFNIDREPWKRSNLEGITSLSRDKWRTELSKTEIYRIESVTADHMRRYGYKLESGMLLPYINCFTGIIKRKLFQFIQRQIRNVDGMDEN